MGNGKTWIHGLIAAVIGGAAGAMESGLTLMVVDGDHFNLNQGLKRTILTMLVFAGLSAWKTAAAYLKQSPVPTGWDGKDRRT